MDCEGTGRLTPSLIKVSSSASAAHSTIAVNERAPASTAHTRQRQDDRQPVADAAPVPRIDDLGQQGQQPRRVFCSVFREVNKLAKNTSSR